MSALLIKQQNMNIAQHALIEDIATTAVRPAAGSFHSDTGSARTATFQCVIYAMNTSRLFYKLAPASNGRNEPDLH